MGKDKRFPTAEYIRRTTGPAVKGIRELFRMKEHERSIVIVILSKLNLNQ